MDYDDGAASRFDLQKVREFKGPLRVAAYVIAFARQQQYGLRNTSYSTSRLFQENQKDFILLVAFNNNNIRDTVRKIY